MNYQGFIWAGIWVQNLDACIDFYQDTLGISLLRRGESFAHFDAGGGALLELMSSGMASSMQKSQQEQSIILGIRVDDLDVAVTELRNRGVKFSGEIGEYGNTRWAHFSDLEGNRLEIKEVKG